MLLYYIRHGEPIYDPDSLTDHGKVQAEVLSEKLRHSGLDKIYASTSKRAMQTAEPTCKAVGMEAELLDFANEGHAWGELTTDTPDGKRWLFHAKDTRALFHREDVIALGHNWYNHPDFAGYDYKAGMNRILGEANAFFASLGYEHEARSGRYKITEKNNKKIALFAHQGFGLAFLSCVLDIPYPIFSTHFDFTHTGVTVIEFGDEGDGYSIPRVLTVSSEAHIYKDGLPTKYSNAFYY
jgi:probable phosphoglycerate mutase